ncbi:MAG: tetratricopeptide repeat protein [Alphaproteobacteria bacterium]
MSHADGRDLPLSTSSGHAAARYREGIDLMLSAWPGAAAPLDDAIAADPGFALAHAARARLHGIRGEAEAARARIAMAGELAARDGDARERSHVAVLSSAIHGRSAEALRRALEHADRWPRDVVVLGLPLGAFGLYAFSGMATHDQARVDLCERHAAHFAGDDWWFLAYRGWSHAENGDAARGRELGERSLALRRENANAVHALAHAMFEGGAGDDAARLLAGWLPGYDQGGTLHGHLAWHGALAALERGDVADALATYERHVRPSASLGLPLNVLSDCVSFLWRLRACGFEAPAGAWDAVAAYAAPLHPRAGFPFADVHMAMLDAATGRRAAVERRVAGLAALVEAGTLAAGPVVPALCRAVLAFAEGDDEGCARLIEPVLAEVPRIGGSGAQREVFEDTLLVALMRGGEAGKARALLDQRLRRRPSPRDAAWRDRLPG